MQTAHELDERKFPSNIFDVSDGIKMKALQQEVLPTLPKKSISTELMAKIEDRVFPQPAKEHKPSNGNLTDEEIFTEVKFTVMEVCKTTSEQFLLKSHKYKYVKARMLTLYFTRLLTKYSLKQLARLCDRDHSTVIHCVQRTYDAIKVRDDKIFLDYHEILKRLQESYNLVPDFKKKWFVDMVNGKKYRLKKFTEKEIKEIQMLSKSLSNQILSRMFDCNERLIARIIAGVTQEKIEDKPLVSG